MDPIDVNTCYTKDGMMFYPYSFWMIVGQKTVYTRMTPVSHFEPIDVNVQDFHKTFAKMGVIRELA